MFKGPTKYSEYIQDVPKSIDYILKRVNAVTVADLQAVTNAGATTTLPINTGGITSDYFQLDTAATPTLAPGMFAWNDAYGTADLRLKGNNVTLQVGQETLARVVNKTGADLLESQYKVVRVRIASEGGAQGQRLAVVLAQGNNDPDSATTLGIVTEDIPNNQEGFITIFGNVNNINTTGSLQGETWVDGDVLYLSPTVPGAITKVKPVAPQHTVIIGYVVYAHNNNGKIFVKVDNGYELDELHNVLITSPANNDLLQYNSAQQVWKNVAPSIAVPTPTLAQVTTAGNTTTNAITVGNATTNNLTIDGTGSILVTQTAYNNLARIGTIGGYDFLYGAFRALFIGDNTNMGRWGITTASASNLHIWQQSPYPIIFATNNTEVMRITPSNNVLIGTTTNAGYKLDVNGTTRTKYLSIESAELFDAIQFKSNTGINGYLSTDGNSVYLGTGAGVSNSSLGIGNNAAIIANPKTHFIIRNNGTETARFTNTTRNLLIGTTTDGTAKLTVAGSITATSALAQGVFFNNTLVAAANNDVLVGLDINPTFTNGAFTGVTNYALRVSGTISQFTSPGATQIRIEGPSGANKSVFFFNTSSTFANTRIYNTGTTNQFIIATGDATIAPTDRFTIFQTGNVAINSTTDAGYKLDVNGTARIKTDLKIETGTGGLTIEGDASGYPTLSINTLRSGVDRRNWKFATEQVSAGDFIFYRSSTGGGTANTVVYAISKDGNFGLGTTTPTDKFHIVDNTNGNKFGRISAGGTNASAAWVAQNDQVDNIVYRVFGSAVTGSQMGQALARSASLIANLGGTGKFLIGSFSGTDLIFGTSDQARMRLVDATGNFLIGTMTDNGNKMTVSGNIDAQGYKVNNVLGYTGIFNVPTNPPGQQNIDIQGGIVINIF